MHVFSRVLVCAADSTTAIEFADAAISWPQQADAESGDARPNEPVLRNLTFSIPRGKIVGVCGGVGVGKTSLLSALIGDTLVDGHVRIGGSIAYVSQQAWIQSATLKDNILFGGSYDAMRYQYAIEGACLRPDLDALPAGDMTEIGERGVNLSGGQKQRVSLARAIYADKDVYLLDDVLSAVDVHVGEFIVREALCGVLADKTIVLVTHQLHFLPFCDTVLFLENGTADVGTHEELLTSNANYKALTALHQRETQGNNADENGDNADGTGVGAEPAELSAGAQRAAELLALRTANAAMTSDVKEMMSSRFADARLGKKDGDADQAGGKLQEVALLMHACMHAHVSGVSRILCRRKS